MLISQHITNNTHWTRKLFVGAGALTLAAVLVPGGFVPQVQAMECANAGVQDTAPDDRGESTNTACGSDAQTYVSGFSTAIGSSSEATSFASTAVGVFADATAASTTAIGQAAAATGNQATAVGVASEASAEGSVALGVFSVADEVDTVSVGNPNAPGGPLTRRITNVAMGARGNDAVTVKQLKKSLKKSFKKGKAKVVKGKIQTSSQNQASTTVAKTAASSTKTKSSGGGSSSQTASVGGPFYSGSSGYSAPGITSSAARSRQSGPLEVVTSDKNGNLATDGGQIFKRLDEGQSGVALAIAMANPDLTGNERFGMASNWGRFEDADALSVTAMGVLAHNLVTKGDRVALAGGFGAGFDEGRGDTVYGGRLGMQWTWGAVR
jgi:hypothetical protein